VTIAREGWPFIAAKYGRIEADDPEGRMLSVYCDIGDSLHGKQPAAVIRIAIVEIHADSRSRRAVGRERGGKYYGVSRRDLVGGNVYLANIERGVCGGFLFQRGDAGCLRHIGIVGHQFGIDQLAVDDIGVGVAEIDLLKRGRAETRGNGPADIQFGR